MLSGPDMAVNHSVPMERTDWASTWEQPLPIVKHLVDGGNLALLWHPSNRNKNLADYADANQHGGTDE